MNNASCYTFNSSQCRQSDASYSGDQSPPFRHYSTFTKKSASLCHILGNEKSTGSTHQQFYHKDQILKISKQEKKSVKINSKIEINEDMQQLKIKPPKEPIKIKKKSNKISQLHTQSIVNEKKSNQHQCKAKKKKAKKHMKLQCSNPQKMISNSLAVSRDYIILGQQIYECEDLNKVNQQLSFGQVKNLYSYAKYQRQLKQNFMKIQKYFKSFAQTNKLAKLSQKQEIDFNLLSQQQKLKLYYALSSQQQQQQMIKIKYEQSITQKKSIQEFIRTALQCVQEKYQRLSTKYPSQIRKLLKWKNQKLHQIQAVNQFIVRNWQSDNIEQLNKQSQSLNQIFEEEIEQLLNQENCFPQIRVQTKVLRTSLVNHLQLQRYPNMKQEQNIEIVIQKVQQQNRLSKQYFGPAGFLWFANAIKSYIKAMPIFFSQVLNNLHRNYRLTKDMKRQLLNQQLKLWPSLLQKCNQIIQMQYPLSDQLFVNFSRDVIGSETKDSPELQNKQKMHIFNKAILDAINDQMQKYLFGYPYGEPLFLKYIDPPIMTQYTITQYSFQAVWDKCLNTVYDSVCMMAGPIIEQQGMHSSRAQILKQQLMKFKNYKQNTLLKTQIKQQYDQFFQLLPLHFGKFHYEIAKQIEDLLIEEFFFEMC